MQGFKGFMRQRVGDEQPEFQEFRPEHFQRVGIRPMASGMPVLEAYQLVNEFNRTQGAARFVHFLPSAA